MKLAKINFRILNFLIIFVKVYKMLKPIQTIKEFELETELISVKSSSRDFTTINMLKI
jgi:hypothetical protein